MSIDKEKKKIADKLRYERNKEKITQQHKEYYEANKEKIIEYQKEYVNKNPKLKSTKIKKTLEEIKEQQKKYYETNRENIIEKQKEYYNKNKEQIKQYYETNKKTIMVKKLEYINNKLSTDSFYKFKHNVRNNISSSIKKSGFKKLSRTEQILGCTFEEFKIYLESKFEPWMTWENYGNWNGIPTEINTAWDIDHIIPTSSGTCEADIIKLNYFTNLQPLCSYNNRYKKRNII